MNHLMLIRTSPLLWLGALTFRANRQDIYEALLAKLDPAGRASVQSVPEILREWANREAARGDTLMHVYQVALRQPNSLAEGLRPFLDNDEYLILSGAEVRGDLLYGVRSLINNVGAQQQMREAVATAAFMPALGLLSLLIMSIGFGIWLWPEFLRSIPEQYWPAWAMLCVRAQVFLGKNWFLGLLLVGLVVLYVVSVDKWTGRTRAIFDHGPPWSIYKGRIAANTLTIMAALVGSGMSLREAFVMIRDRASPYLAWHMNRIIRGYDTTGGNGLEALRSGLFSERMMDRVEDATAGRSFDETLREVGGRSLATVVRTLRSQANAAAAVVMVILGLLFMYITVVTVFGVQDATDAYVNAVSRGGPAL